MTNKHKIGDIMRIKPGLVGAGQTGIIQMIKPWSLDSPYPELREDYYWLKMEDGIEYHFHWSCLEPEKNISIEN